MTPTPEPNQRSPLRYLLSSSAAVFVARLTSAALKLATLAILARWAAREDIGVYLLALSAAGFLAVCGMVGADLPTIRRVAGAFTRGDAGEALREFHRALGLALGASILVAVAFWALFPAVETHLLTTPWFGSNTHWVAICVVATACLALCTCALQGAKELARSAVFGNLLFPALFLGLVAFQRTQQTEQLAASQLLRSLAIASLASALCAVLVVELGWRWRRSATPPASPDVELRPASGWLIFESLPLLGAQLLAYGITQGDLWLVGEFDHGAVATYGVATRLAFVPGVVLGISAAVVSPLVVEYHTSERLPALERLLQRVACVASLLALGYCVPVLVFAEAVLSRGFGPEFVLGAPMLRLLLVAQLLPVLSGGAMRVLILLGHQALALKITALGGLVFLTLGPVLCWRWGGVGAALTLAASQLCLCGLSLAAVRREFGVWVWASPMGGLRGLAELQAASRRRHS